MKLVRLVLLSVLSLLIANCSQTNPEYPGMESAFKRYEISRLTFQLPATWELVDLPKSKSTHGAKSIYGFQNTCAKNIAFCENVVISFSPNDTNMSAKELRVMLDEALRERYNNYAPINIQDTIINNIYMSIIDYKFTKKINLRSTAVLFVTDSVTTQIGFTASNESAAAFASNKLFFERFIASISKI